MKNSNKEKNGHGLLLVGSADLNGKTVGGQLEKTKAIYYQLLSCGMDVTFCNMFEVGAGLGMVLRFMRAYFKNQYIVIVTSNRGTAVMVRLVRLLSKVKRRCVAFLLVGNQVEGISKFSDKQLDGINRFYVEVDEMRNRIGLKNKVGFFSNCKIINKQDASYELKKRPTICFYSEISYRKGFDLVVDVLDEINQKDIQLYLDVYGFFSDEKGEKREMMAMIKERNYIRYKGVLKKAEAAIHLKKYLFMAFPSRHKMEGVPGAIVDAYEAGLPVISSDVSYLPYIVRNGITGYVFHDKREFKDIMERAINAPERVINLRKNCLKEADKYDIKAAVDGLMTELLRMRDNRT